MLNTGAVNIDGPLFLFGFFGLRDYWICEY
jgi:hypothetical protein